MDVKITYVFDGNKSTPAHPNAILTCGISDQGHTLYTCIVSGVLYCDFSQVENYLCNLSL